MREVPCHENSLPFIVEVLTPEQVQHARLMAQMALAHTQMPPDQIDELLYVLSELATNGQEHAGGAVVSLSLRKQGRLRLEVFDRDASSVPMVNAMLAQPKVPELSLADIDALPWEEDFARPSPVTDGRGLRSIGAFDRVEATIAVPIGYESAVRYGKCTLVVYQTGETLSEPVTAAQASNDLPQAA